MQETISLIFSYVRGMWRYRWTGLVGSVLACVIAWCVVLLLPNQYQASSRVQIDTSSVLKPLLKGLTVDSDSVDRVTVITRVMLSRPNLAKVVREADLDLAVKNDRELELLLLDVRKRISINRPFNSREDKNSPIVFLDIAFTDNAPKVAQKVVQLLVNTLVENTLGESRTDSTDAQKFLLDQIKSSEQQLKLSEQRLADFKRENMGMLPGQGGDYYARLQAAIESLGELKTEHSLAVNRYEVLRQQLKGEVPVLGQNPQVVAIDEQIAANEQKLNQLLLLYTDHHPDVLGVQRTITQLNTKKEQVLEEIKSLGADASSANKQALEISPVYQSVKIALREAEVEVQALLAKMTTQQTRVNELKKMVDTVPEVEARLIDLDRDYEVVKTQYVAMLSKLESAKLSEDVRSSNFDIKFQIIEPAIVPFTPSAPNREMLLAGATGAGIAVGCGLMFLLNMLFPVYITTRELNNDLGLPVLGRVSMIFSRQEKVKRRIGYFVYSGLFSVLIVFAGLLILYKERAVELTQRLFSELPL